MTLSCGATGGIGEDAITTGLVERILLEREGLIVGGDASIAKQHLPIVSQLVTLHKYGTMNIGRDCETPLYSGRRWRGTTLAGCVTNDRFWDARPASRTNWYSNRAYQAPLPHLDQCVTD